MGIMNLADVDCTTHAVQLGLFLFIAYHVPDIYRAYIWEGRPQEMIIIKAVRGLLTTAGLTALLHRLGTAIYWIASSLCLFLPHLFFVSSNIYFN